MATERSAGFTIVEVAVALAIVALAFGVALGNLSGALGRLGGTYRSTTALGFAESLLDRVGYDIALDPGDTSGVTQEGYGWTIETRPYLLPSISSATSPLRGYTVTVTVAWTDRGNA